MTRARLAVAVVLLLAAVGVARCATDPLADMHDTLTTHNGRTIR